MEYVRLGATGLDVSRICLGLHELRRPGRGGHPWSLDEDAPRPFIRRALEAGINFFDTANVYSAGSSEEITGRALKRLRRPRRRRARHQGARPDAARARTAPGLSRKAILTEIDAQPAPARHRLRRPLPDPPLGPAHARSRRRMEALHDVVKAGKARYIGASSMYAWQFAKAQHVAERNGWTRFVSHAGPLQPALPRGGAGDAAAVRSTRASA